MITVRLSRAIYLLIHRVNVEHILYVSLGIIFGDNFRHIVYVHVHLFSCMGGYARVRVYLEARGEPRLLFPRSYPPCF